MNMIRYEPWDAARSLHREFDRLLRRNNFDAERDSVADWVPAVDLREEETRYVLHVDVPGVNPNDIDIALENGILSLSGHRELTTREEKDGYRRVERVAGKFFRRFTLPDGVDPDAVSARSENGVLEIGIPKAAKAQRKRIEINVD